MLTTLGPAAEFLMVGFIYSALVALRQHQPDPNPAIEAREAAAAEAELSGVLAAGLVCLVPPAAERRADALPFVGQDRRQQEMASDAGAWRRSA